MVLLEGKNLSKSFPVEGGIWRRRIGHVQALKNVSFDIVQTETLALVGGSGCGKSTLAKILAGLLAADSGSILWEGQPLEKASRLERAQRIQMIFQDPYASLNPKLSIGSQLHEVLRLSFSRKRESMMDPRFHGDDINKRSIQLLESVGLSADVLAHYPFQFSGGQRQRMAIARALAMNPQLLIADEPLSSLDVTTQAQILDLFRKLKKELGLTILFITHDLAVANAFSERIIVLKEGSIVEEGATRTVLTKPRESYTQALLSAVPKIPC